MFSITITLVIVIITAIISYNAFNNNQIKYDLIMYPPAISERKQWYRLFSYGLIHADFIHLAFNMYALYLFGSSLESDYKSIFGNVLGSIFYLLLYIFALLFSILPSYKKNETNSGYSSLGASGAVSAVIFASIVLRPKKEIGFLFLPKELYFPGYIFGIVYLIASYYMAKKKNDNINHEAHYWGAVFGIIFTILTTYFIAHYPVFTAFINQVAH
ncbi:rhomboid family intramembrane serine protease [Polluticaenibacter yanchengensis]|uniref:Rhomboid family intramembrane serine protease n=1 Tax=Polluticaenibacter yanchengensis TaxID=3014562 RepID=A0ABT4UL97_9BACT|nr:rhomboid family intramembrane serine protease [Chitinophagaceae bacterium LY-5]